MSCNKTLHSWSQHCNDENDWFFLACFNKYECRTKLSFAVKQYMHSDLSLYCFVFWTYFWCVFDKTGQGHMQHRPAVSQSKQVNVQICLKGHSLIVLFCFTCAASPWPFLLSHSKMEAYGLEFIDNSPLDLEMCISHISYVLWHR